MVTEIQLIEIFIPKFYSASPHFFLLFKLTEELVNVRQTQMLLPV